MKRVILFGGSFDPIHYGHLTMIQRAMKQMKAHEGWFVLADTPPLKDRQLASFEKRLSYIHMMIKPFDKLKACTIEKELPQPNYTINTVTYLQQRHPDIEFLLLIGSDQASQFTQWKDYLLLLEKVVICVYDRHNDENSLNFVSIEGPLLDVSSTQIRQGLSQQTHPAILNDMIKKGIYGQEMLSTYLSDKRVSHCFEVAKLMKEFAQVYPIDPEVAYGLGLIHDLMKQKEKDKELDFILSDNDKFAPEYEWHAIACHHVLTRYYKIKDHDFTNAIYHHVSGNSNSLLGMLLYVADKCERTRGYDSEHLIELTKKDVYLGFKKVRSEAKKYREGVFK